MNLKITIIKIGINIGTIKEWLFFVETKKITERINPNIPSKKLDALDVRAIERWRKNQHKANKKN